ncbi:MAG TPA: hypothetical protein PLB52_02290 [Candidatus Moranbacteria bacterium]|nr:hypothetical protein [Candidatus Moranbacteria bacterium]
MALSQYHQKYSNYSEEEIQKRADEKEAELKSIFEKVSLKTESEIIKLAVMGSGDKRFAKHHKRIFEKFVQKPVEVTTFDITTEHLEGEERIIQHDCTKTLPNAPYDITYVHVLLIFIETKKQWDVIENSYDALKRGGIAIHVFDKGDYSTNEKMLADGYFAVPLREYENKLKELNIDYFEVPVKYGLALVLVKS